MSSVNFFEVIFLSIVQGTTEFFPISSSGHLVLFQFLFGIREPQIMFDIVLHGGTLLAIILYLRKDIIEILFSIIKSKNESNPFLIIRGHIFLLYMLIALIPTALIGILFDKEFEKLFGTLKYIGYSFLITGIILFITKYAKERRNVHVIHPFLIGIFQGLAIAPGISRSGMTIGIALLLGWKKEIATKFSFLLSIPAILGALFYESLKVKQLQNEDLTIMISGVFFSFLVGLISLKYLFSIIKKGKFFIFSFYCFFVGILMIFYNLFWR
ncbi:MAG: undecaprenyl-diphosphate phosphatase [Acidobacteriota bacterium]